MENILDKIKFNEQGLVPAVLQDIDSREVLMVAYMNAESLQQTIETGKACFWSRSRQEIWLKGESSGNYQLVEEIRFDCDNDTLLVMVRPTGPACHTGKKSCFYRKLSADKLEETKDDEENAANIKINKYSVGQNRLERASFLFKLYELIADRKENPVEESYTNYLFTEGIDKICKKVGEEAAEVIIGAKNASNEEIIYEISDLIYHLMVLMNFYNISLEEIFGEMESRNK